MTAEKSKDVSWGGFIPAPGEKRNVAYALTHIKTKMVYAGSTSCMHDRRKAHLSQLKRNVHHAVKLQNAFNDDPNFDLKIYLAEDREGAFEVEQKLISLNMLAGTSLNTAADARRSALGYEWSKDQRDHMAKIMTGRVMSTQTRNKLSLSKKGKPIHINTRLAVSQAKTGSKQKPETIAKIKASSKANLVNGKLPPEHASKIRKYNEGRRYKVSADGVIFNTVKEAVVKFGLTPTGVQWRCVKEKWPTWFYIKNE